LLARLAQSDDELVARWARRFDQAEDDYSISSFDSKAYREQLQRDADEAARRRTEREAQRLTDLQRERDEQYAHELEEQKRTEPAKRARAESHMKRVLKHKRTEDKK
jgi:hypothetical protein